MIEAVILTFAVTAGGALGAIFFGGLWWTVERGLTSPVPALWFLSSLLIRTGITLAGFWLVSQGHWQRTLACLLGFMIARILAARLTRATTDYAGCLPLERITDAP